MRVKPPARPQLAEPPPALRRFGSVYGAGEGLGRDLYTGGPAWVAARHEWQDRHGVTLDAWFAAAIDDARTFGLDANQNGVLAVPDRG